MKVRWTEEAIARLSAIAAHVARDRPVAAHRLVARLLARGESLGRFPRRGRAVPELDDPEWRELVVSGYRLVYRVQADCVQIITVFEGHRRLR
jgi:plasmid stabilization system protein ParE